MFGKSWRTSERKYGVIVERSVKIPMRDAVQLDADVFRPDGEGTFPAVLGFHPYDPVPQCAPIFPTGFAAIPQLGLEKPNGPLEAGDPHFYVRRGYVHVVASIRGTGRSSGHYPFLGSPEPEDGHDLIEWIARQPWCSGNVGMFGVSYFARIPQFIAGTRPPHLKCIFSPWASTDQYRDVLYKGGILAHNWAVMWAKSLNNLRYQGECRREWGEARFKEALSHALRDPDLREVSGLVAALAAPDEGAGALVADVVLSPFDGPFWDSRKVNYERFEVPAYLGGDWAIYGLHLAGAFRSWERVKGPKKMLIGPPAYLDRPVYQLQYESLRWFDYWLKGIETGIMQEPPIRLFLTTTRQWRTAHEWPLPETKWTPFYLHEGGLLWEREHFPNEGSTSFHDSPWGRGSAEFTTPKLVEETEVIGPAVLNLYASTTDQEVLWFASLREVDAEGRETILTRGWLRGSHRAVDHDRSKPWEPFHPHTRVEPLQPGQVYEFNIGIVPTGHLFKAGSRIKLKISCCDDPPTNSFEVIGTGHIRRQTPSRVTVYHNADHPSHLLLPITSGNVMGTYISGGHPYL